MNEGALRWRIAAFLVVTGLFGLAWAVTDPLGAAPDEPAHYIRALATGAGDWRGTPATWSDAPITPAQQTYLDSTTRRFRVPAQLSPVGTTLPCFALKPTVPANCSDVPTRPGHHFNETYVGAYQPVPYLLPGLAARLGNSESSGFRFARLAALAACLALIAAALFAYVDTLGRLASAALALTPSALFLMGSLNSSGIEYASAMALTAALLAALRRGRGWVLVCVAGSVLAWSRPTGPAEVGFLFVVSALSRPVALRARAAKWSLALLVTAAASSSLWHFASGLRGSSGIPDVRRIAVRVLTQQVAAFGWTGEVSAPRPVAWLWLLAIASLLMVAARRRPWPVGIAGVGYLAMLGALIIVNAGTGFGVGGRYLLPLLPLLPLVAGEVVPYWRRWCTAAVLAVWPLAQALGWFVNSRRYAVGIRGPIAFWHGAAWSPPGGWPCWLAVVAIATVSGLWIGGARSLGPRRKSGGGLLSERAANHPAEMPIGA